MSYGFCYILIAELLHNEGAQDLRHFGCCMIVHNYVLYFCMDVCMPPFM